MPMWHCCVAIQPLSVSASASASASRSCVTNYKHFRQSVFSARPTNFCNQKKREKRKENIAIPLCPQALVIIICPTFVCQFNSYRNVESLTLTSKPATLFSVSVSMPLCCPCACCSKNLCSLIDHAASDTCIGLLL